MVASKQVSALLVLAATLLSPVSAANKQRRRPGGFTPAHRDEAYHAAITPAPRPAEATRRPHIPRHIDENGNLVECTTTTAADVTTTTGTPSYDPCSVGGSIVTPTSDATTTTSMPVITGFVPTDCLSSIWVFFDSIPTGYPGTRFGVFMNSFSATAPSLSVDIHTATAQAGHMNPNFGFRGEARTFFVAAPTGGGGGDRRRRLQCAQGQDRCLSADGSVQCVAALRTNLEQCGVCGGPDCTALPHVDAVVCQEGQCIIEGCLEGFELRNGQCEATGLVLQA